MQDSKKVHRRIGHKLSLEGLDSLVAELLKNKPNEILIKKWMGQAGLVYCTDPATRINNVLRSLTNLPHKGKNHETHL